MLVAIIIVIIVLFLAYYAFDDPTTVAAAAASSSTTTTNASSLTPSTSSLLTDNSTCSAATDCQGGQCVFGRCTSAVSGSPACSATAPCPTPANQYCDNGVCVNMQKTADCDPGCAAGYTCIQSACAPVAGYNANMCNNTCDTGKICTSQGCLPADGNVYTCSSNSDCISKTGPDSVCNTQGYCSCSYDIPTQKTFGCFTGSPLLIGWGLPEGSAFPKPWDVLTGYVSNSDGYSMCNGVICSGYQQCISGVCT